MDAVEEINTERSECKSRCKSTGHLLVHLLVHSNLPVKGVGLLAVTVAMGMGGAAMGASSSTEAPAVAEAMADKTEGRQGRPNIILMMADDLGYGDTGFNGNKIIRTPHLDRMAQDGVKLTHFYAGNSVCSPTRGTCLTGRHHHRYGIWTANVGHLPKQEITLARMLKQQGYATGHFGKWHLGTLSKTISSKGERRKPAENFAPPWERDYDRSFVTESAVTTWNPGVGKRARNNPFYDDGVAVDPNDTSLQGGAARVVVDRAVPFMEQAVKEGKPFLSVVWFHAPHEDIEAGPDYLEMYEGQGDAAHYYGCITELDEQVGAYP